jgi:hypothetical protein
LQLQAAKIWWNDENYDREKGNFLYLRQVWAFIKHMYI